MSQFQSLDCRENIMTADQSVADKRLNYNYHLDKWGEGGGGVHTLYTELLNDNNNTMFTPQK